MAKELPYFKFEPNQWENGNIQMCTREDKGLFMDICSMYWSRLGDLPEKLVVQKLCGGNANALRTLYDEGIIAKNDDKIHIGFLSEQLQEFENKSNKNSSIAKEAWLKRKQNKDLQNSDANVLRTQSERNTIREDKSRVEDKKNTIDIRKLKFADTLKPFLSIYGKDMLNDFYLYWTEPNKSNTKFRQELEKTWNLERRLSTWANNESKYGKPKANLSYSEMNLEQLQNYVSEVVIAERLYNNMEVIPPELKGYFDKMCKRLAQFIKANIDTVKNKSIADIMALEKKSNIGKL